MKWLLDTNVLSELRRPRPDASVTRFLSNSPIEDFYTSSVTLAEFRFGISIASSATRKAEIEFWLKNSIRPTFRDRVLEVTEETILLWRVLMEQGRKAGRTYPQPDLLIAAIAIENNLTLVTRNTRDFMGLTLPILNPWEPQP